ncbi:MAG: efflux RND transporter periplasmic adaptor subunit [Candidatus Delongbacteria bacterium]|nr:efflux RND transporter periplasmic adaptor subunit [Candidatus Delongbacteria bacterium]MCG2760422.1 efflux RND transporter periplasmic adaptor subunit [Candidatus Delongbacteria bacterium]
MKRKYFITTLSLLLLILTSCTKEEAAAKEDTSIEALQMKNGVPVRVHNIVKQDLVQWDEYSGTLSGFEEISAFGLLGDNFSKVNVAIGDVVKKDDVLAEFPTNNPGANYNQAKIGYETVEKTYERVKRVYESGGISQQQLDEIEAQYKIAKENFNATKQLIKVISPTSGVVVDIYFNEGDMNDPKLPFCKIVKTNKLKTSIFIEEEKIANYKKGQEVMIRWDGLKDRDFKGIINKISMSSNPEARGFSVEILADNESDELMPGTFVYVQTPVFRESGAIAIPRDAYFSEGGKDFVYLVDNGLALKREITRGKSIGNIIQIKAGLSVGDKLISEGRSLLQDGTKISIVN